MKERPILFSGPMIRAILEDRKTQTRRVVKGEIGPCTYAPGKHALNGQAIEGNPGIIGQCPYGQPGDRLWVRETWSAPGAFAEHRTGRVAYRADADANPYGQPWKPSIHMPRWASRLTLEVTEVRVQRLQEISEKDARAEGIKPVRSELVTPRDAFHCLWDSINGERPGCSWEDNPWVWCVSFRRVT